MENEEEDLLRWELVHVLETVFTHHVCGDPARLRERGIVCEYVDRVEQSAAEAQVKLGPTLVGEFAEDQWFRATSLNTYSNKKAWGTVAGSKSAVGVH